MIELIGQPFNGGDLRESSHRARRPRMRGRGPAGPVIRAGLDRLARTSRALLALPALRGGPGLGLLRSVAIGVAVPLAMLALIAPSEASEKWTNFVAVPGQPEPIPEQWLQDEEARIAHSLRLPDAVAKTVPFDFERARRKASWPGTAEVGRQYFDHLCDTEAGEWFLKQGEPQRGLYDARPLRKYETAELQARYELEAPLLVRLHRIADTINSGSWFVNPPALTYEFVQEPRRDVDWQAEIKQPYIELFGFQAERPWEAIEARPMQMKGIDRPTARYAVTWRGTRRKLDREHSISGVEIIVYERATSEVLAVRRQFVYAPPYPNRPETNSWAQGRTCRRVGYTTYGGEHLSRLPALVVPPVRPMRGVEPTLKVPTPPGASTSR